MNTIDSFWGGWRFLSNFWAVPVAFEGHTYPSVEHAYQAAKTTSDYFREQIRNCDTPGLAKRMGRQITIRKDWDSIKIEVMRTLLREKFSHPALRAQLLKTCDAELIEGNDHGDYFWGMVDGSGQNWLGKLLMELRTELQACA